ncbi:hypothetical protein C7U65_13840, partial [Bradyrhizobium sp. WBAH23]|nr:hypothetical protein [Bradyrhizobium sp. WBAH30]MDD1544689.1 hypothetical protein [Bradyrhizobium sp. WBAH41]MDD1556701.1 hypothetical protein [Bradyrhizobium sp. WBAH23]MDD1564503.1 hypothetical protein [Bradyrhizobium sp. WBAH33]
RRGAVPTSVLEAQVDKAAPGGSARTASLHPKAATNPTRVQGGLAEGVIHHIPTEQKVKRWITLH